jgi:hypothetical protein
MIFLFLTPVLITEFKLVYSDTVAYHVLGSPSHRIYLATVGMSITIGSILAWIAKAKHAMLVVASILLFFNLYEVKQREKIWEFGTNEIRDSVMRLRDIRPSFPENSTAVFVNFPLPEGFFRPFMNVYYNLQDVEIVSLKKIDPKLPDPEEFDVDVNRYYYGFIRGKKKVYDISDSVRTLMSLAYSYKKGDESARRLYREEYEQLAIELNTIIPRIEQGEK